MKLSEIVVEFLFADVAPWEIVVALTVAPLLAGLIVGTAVRSWRRHSARSARAAVAILLLSTIAAAVVGVQFRMGVWDAASIGLLAGIGLVAGLYAWRSRRREVALAIGALVAALAVAEGMARVLLPPPPGYAAIEGASVFLPPVDLEEPEPARGDFAERHREAIDGCALLFPDSYPGHVAERTARDHSARGSVLYLGDSMTYGLGVPMDQAFPAQIERLDPSSFHVNLGFPGTSVDYHYFIARQWIDQVAPPVRLVAVGLYFNDILEIGQSMPCCSDRSLLVFEDGRPPVMRCKAPKWTPGYGESLAWFLRHSPSPYPLRAAMPYSRLACYVEALRSQHASRRAHTDSPFGGDEWKRMREILAVLHADLAQHEIPLVVVLLPARAALEALDPTSIDDYRLTQRLQQLAIGLGIRTLDPWEYFRDLVERDGSAEYFIGDRDIHFSPAGHRAMAQWLADNLDEVGALE